MCHTLLHTHTHTREYTPCTHTHRHTSGTHSTNTHRSRHRHTLLHREHHRNMYSRTQGTHVPRENTHVQTPQHIQLARRSWATDWSTYSDLHSPTLPCRHLAGRLPLYTHSNTHTHSTQPSFCMPSITGLHPVSQHTLPEPTPEVGGSIWSRHRGLQTLCDLESLNTAPGGRCNRGEVLWGPQAWVAEGQGKDAEASQFPM